MTDEWAFRTANGRGVVAGGRLRVERSPSGVARRFWVRGWTERGRWRRALSLVSAFGAVTFLSRTVAELRAALAGEFGAMQAFALAATAALAGVLATSAVGGRTVPLHRVRSVRRVGDASVRVRYADGDGVGEVDVDALTEADAEAAVEMLRLKGAPAGGTPDEEEARAVGAAES